MCHLTCGFVCFALVIALAVVLNYNKEELSCFFSCSYECYLDQSGLETGPHLCKMSYAAAFGRRFYEGKNMLSYKESYVTTKDVLSMCGLWCFKMPKI
ncbi:Hypothetical predicted protein [Mytilus galloprovincialis]|uniref:Secreted protein n=1 Tax=Mytilus galloprovincialis TaxID=29158 RepID=A0A8B6EIS5_MYTGA|nr:Hypothetical predicted protein [Mytilus galloprovincialis]